MPAAWSASSTAFHVLRNLTLCQVAEEEAVVAEVRKLCLRGDSSARHPSRDEQSSAAPGLQPCI